MDSDGYGYTADDHGVGRLLEDLRTLSPSGIERVAHGWELYGLPHLERYHEAEAAALAAIENAHLTTDWESIQRAGARPHRGPVVAGVVEGRTWREGSPRGGGGARRCAGAARGRPSRPRATPRRSLRPMAEALPWLATVG